MSDNIAMDIQSLATNMAQGQVQEEAAIRVQAMSLSNLREQAEELSRLMSSAQVLSDPSRGNHVDILG